jgi:hypothetical protein
MDARGARLPIIIVVLLALSRVAAFAADGGTCPAGYISLFNANIVGCTFCAVNNSATCNVACLAAPSCTCTPGAGLDACCAASPCCDNCPEAGSLACNLSTCSCEPTDCCFTTCPPPKVAAPALGSPNSAAFGLAAATLALGGVLLINRRRRQRRS